MEGKQSMIGPKLFVACGAVRRIRKNKDYFSRDYEVCLTNGGLLIPSFPIWKVGAEQEPSRTVLDNLRHHMKLFGTSVYPLAVSSNPVQRATDHAITLFYVIPVSLEDTLSEEGKYHNLSQVLENNDQLQPDQRAMLNSLDQWIRERHTLPYVNIDAVFLCSREGEGVGGLVKAIIENPIYGSHLRPPEDNLVISLNNPVFELTTTNSVDTTITSNA